MTRREFAVRFRGQLLNEAPDLTSDAALRRAMRAQRKTRGIGYADDAVRNGMDEWLKSPCARSRGGPVW